MFGVSSPWLVRAGFIVRASFRISVSMCGYSLFFSFHVLPNVNKMMILADGERMLRVLFVIESERM